MIESRKSYNTSERLLREKQNEFEYYCKERDNQINEITDKEKQLRESFEFFDIFVRENIEKRERAEEKIIKEKETCKIINHDINKINERIIYLHRLKENMIKAIANNEKFENYLFEVGKALPNEFR